MRRLLLGAILNGRRCDDEASPGTPQAVTEMGETFVVFIEFWDTLLAVTEHPTINPSLPFKLHAVNRVEQFLVAHFEIQALKGLLLLRRDTGGLWATIVEQLLAPDPR